MATCKNCKDCFHYELCGVFGYISPVECGFYTDRSRFVELPCKVGDLIYIIKKARGFSVRGAKVNSITITESGKIQVSCYRSSFIGLWSDDAFATKEEAEQALKERESE